MKCTQLCGDAVRMSGRCHCGADKTSHCALLQVMLLRNMVLRLAERGRALIMVLLLEMLLDAQISRRLTEGDDAVGRLAGTRLQLILISCECHAPVVEHRRRLGGDREAIVEVWSVFDGRRRRDERTHREIGE